MSIPNVNLGGSGIRAINTILRVSNNASPVVYNPVGNQCKITTKMSTEKADTTNQGNIWDQSIATRMIGGPLTCEIQYIPDSLGQDSATGIVGHSMVSAGALGQMFRQQEVRTWSITFPDGAGFYFQAYILDFPVDADPTGKSLILNMTLQITGEPTFFG